MKFIKTDTIFFEASCILALIFSFIILFCSFSRVPAGSVGVVTLFGNLSPTVLPPGVHFLNPFSIVNDFNIKDLTNSTKSEAPSNDLQKFETTIFVNYNLTVTDPTNFYSQFGVNVRSNIPFIMSK